MAEGAAAELVKVIFAKLADEAFKKYARAQGIHSKLENLGETLSQIQAVLDDAFDKDVNDAAVKEWLNSLQHLAYDIGDILDDVAIEAKHRELTLKSETSISKVRNLILPTCCTNFSLSHRLGPKIDSITIELQRLYREKADLGLIEKDEKKKDSSRGNETSLVESDIVGREGEKERLLNKLLGDGESSKENFRIVPIIGMGGIGKTTLARHLYNDPKVKNHFEIRAWVCVSNDFNILEISKTILQDVCWCNLAGPTRDPARTYNVNMEINEFRDLQVLQVALYEQLKDKRFLLVLDDVWSESYEDWQLLVRPFHSVAPGSKVIVTSRKGQLFKVLGFDHLDYLNSLPNEDSLSLLALHALGVNNFDSHPTLRAMGESFVEKCGGLPLALKAIGRLLRTKPDKEFWDSLLKSEAWGFEIANEIFPTLKLSYHELSASLKRMFSYCALFPKNFLFDKEELILLWMAEGYLDQLDAKKSAERMGHECFDILLSRSFFQHAPNDESLFIMHDLLNDLATFVAEDYFLLFDKEIKMAEEALPKHRHMSFIREEYVAYEKFEAFKRAISLRTLVAVSTGVKQSWDTFYLSSKILVDLFQNLPLLRVLSLSRFEISEVPDSIGSLKQLTYLNLSQTKIKRLPHSVGNLYNLQSLIVFGCTCLAELPESFIKLKLLRHFDIRDTPLLRKLPLGVGELRSLHTLSKIIIGGDNGFVITKLKGLTNLYGEISIEGLHNMQNLMPAREANLSLKRLTKLELKWDDGSRNTTLDKEVLNELMPNSDSLKELTVVSYCGTNFPNWVGDSSFHRLVRVSVRGCRKCTSLPPLGQLASLKELFIQGMDDVQVIGSEFIGNTRVAFPSLEILVFEDMLGWKIWSTNNHYSDEWFPCLRELHIKNCPKLIQISFEELPSLEILVFEDMLGWEIWSTNNHDSDESFPCLRELHIKNCPKLIKVSLEELPSLRVLQIDRCDDCVLRSLVYLASSIAKLEIMSIFGLTYEVWKGVIEHLGAVEEIRIYGCSELIYLWESEAEASKVLVNLKKLYVYDCSDLISLGEKEEGEDNPESNLLSSLKILDVWNCNNMKHCCCPDSIESLCLSSCSSVTSVSFPTTGGGQKLKSLDISLCQKQKEKINYTNMPMLEYAFIYHWTNLKSITELTSLIHLTHLELYDCPSVKSFPDVDLSNNTSLQFLLIEKCPSIDSSFPRGIWPLKLVTLGIGGLKRPISKWGPQNFPNSLVNLTLYGEQVSSFHKLSHLLPSSLSCLCIEEFDNLESLSVGLQHLTSLQHLHINRCPRMMDLPETLLPSLLSLIIEECPNLEERCNGKDSHYSPLISHIPRIETQYSD